MIKRNDVVVCIDTTNAPMLKKGEKYLVEEVMEDGFLSLRNGIFSPHRFVKE